MQDLDAALRVGVPRGAITELVGPAGVGKSQMAMGLALSAALPRELQGLGATVMYIGGGCGSANGTTHGGAACMGMDLSCLVHATPLLNPPITYTHTHTRTACMHTTTDTEGKLSVPRMQEIALARAARVFAEQQQQSGHPQQQSGHPPQALTPATQARLEELALSALDRVLVVKAGALGELRAALNALDDQVPRRGARLVVLDSVAALLRAELGAGRQAARERAELVGLQAAALKALAERHRVPVVVTNQVTARPTGPAAHAFQGGGGNDGGGGGNDGDGHLSAALGTKWAHGVNVRLVLERQGSQRFIKIAKSPLSPSLAFEYAITAAGVQQVGAGPVDAARAGVGGSALAIPIANEAPPDWSAGGYGDDGGWGGGGGGWGGGAGVGGGGWAGGGGGGGGA